MAEPLTIAVLAKAVKGQRGRFSKIFFRVPIALNRHRFATNGLDYIGRPFADKPPILVETCLGNKMREPRGILDMGFMPEWIVVVDGELRSTAKSFGRTSVAFRGFSITRKRPVATGCCLGIAATLDRIIPAMLPRLEGVGY